MTPRLPRLSDIDYCPQCGIHMTTGVAADHAASGDHILPRQWGGTFVIHDNVRNKRIMCRSCNTLLGTCGHCVGALACVRAVANAGGWPQKIVIRKWGLGVIAYDTPAPQAAAIRERRYRAPPSYPHAAQRVAVARAIDRIGLDEFVFPADTAAARVWNLATLGRGYAGRVAW